MSHTAPKSLSDYRKDIDSALEDSFLRRTLDTFAVAYRANREAVFKEVDERGLIKQIADAKDDACKHMEELYEQFRRVAEERGVHVPPRMPTASSPASPARTTSSASSSPSP